MCLKINTNIREHVLVLIDSQTPLLWSLRLIACTSLLIRRYYVQLVLEYLCEQQVLDNRAPWNSEDLRIVVQFTVSWYLMR